MPRPWTYLTNHALILLHVYEHPSSTLREIAQTVGITERASLSILRQLEKDRCIRRSKQGRRIHYTVNLRAVFTRGTGTPYSIEEIVRPLANLLNRLGEREEPAAGEEDEPREDENQLEGGDAEEG